jgi:mannose-1-phosphate guanylyltransferase
MPRNHTVIIDGLKDYVVVEEGDVLMICPKENAATMRRMMTEAQTQLNIE